MVSFESLTYLTFLKNHVKALENDKTIRLMERSLLSTYNVFVKNLKNSGTIDNSEFIILSEWYDYLTKTEINLTDYAIVYLYCAPEILLDRITKRGRSEEKQIELSYLKELDRLHGCWIDSEFAKGTKVFTLHTDKHIIETKEDFKSLIVDLRSHFLNPLTRKKTSISNC